MLFAALIIGAALIMRIETRSTFLGYPTLAVVLLLVGAIGSVALAVAILIEDLGRKKR